MSGKNKNKAQSLGKSIADNEFDVKKNLQKLRTGKPIKSSVATVEDFITSESRGISSTLHEVKYQTGDVSQIAENFHSKYDKLKDDFGSLKDSFSSQITDVNKNFLQKNDFYIQAGFIVLCFVTAATIIYQISYKDLVDDNRSLKNQNQELLQKLKEIEEFKKETQKRNNQVSSELKELSNEIDTVESKLNKIRNR